MDEAPLKGEDEFEKWWSEQDGISFAHAKKSIAKRAYLAGRKSLQAELLHWKANHDNQVKLKAAIASRPDLQDRAELVKRLEQERDDAREALLDALERQELLYDKE